MAPQADLDPLIHAPARLRIMVSLATLAEGDSLSFSRLRQLLDMTAGNLITHLRKLEDAGYLLTSKGADQGGTRTSVHLTQAGRAALEEYSATLRRLLEPTSRQGTG